MSGQDSARIQRLIDELGQLDEPSPPRLSWSAVSMGALSGAGLALVYIAWKVAEVFIFNPTESNLAAMFGFLYAVRLAPIGAMTWYS
jgi:hypothetical protein